MVGELAGIDSQTQKETHRRFSVYARATVKTCTFQESYRVHSNMLLHKGIMDSIKPWRSTNQYVMVKDLFFSGKFCFIFSDS